MVFNMSLNPSGTLLAAIDVSGNLSLWEIPSFRQKNFWPLKQLVHNLDVELDQSYQLLLLASK